MNKALKEIPIFFAIDDDYTPFLAVALKSLIENANIGYRYSIKILHTNMQKEHMEQIMKYTQENVSIEFVDLSYYIEKVKDKLYTRDYYTNTTYFRLFLPELYPQYDKVLYLDSDIIVVGDISELYNIDMGTNLIAAAPDDIIQYNKVFQDYAELVVGVEKYQHYFNAGVLLMNLDELRKFDFQKKFLYLLGTVKFSVAQDQDYLNRLCKGRVKLISHDWDVMPYVNDETKPEDIKIIHYNFAYKPWHFEDVTYNEYFWKYAKDTEFYEEILEIKNSYTEEQRFQDREAEKELAKLAEKENACVGDDRVKKESFMKNMNILTIPMKYLNDRKKEQKNTTEKTQSRIEVLKKIEELEKEGKFDIDVEDDPPTVELTPNDVDYLREKTTSKIKTRFAYEVGERFLNNALKNSKLIIKDIKGIENLKEMKTGAIVTCNHFNPYDCFTIEKVFRMAGKADEKKLYKVIREGNYTNFPGFYGFLFRNCDTLPLSSNKRTMVNFMKAVDTILKKGDFVLVYPEQSMWWNYRKPKPLKPGAFKLATRNNVPIIPIFITMQDSDKIDDEGFPIQEYIVNIEKPIYPDENLTQKENIKNMLDKNFEVWKNIYEQFYETPLEYTTKKGKVVNEK